MADTVSLDGEGFTREEVQALYHSIFTITNNEAPQHEPTAAMRAQLKLAAALGEEVPEAAIQDWQRAVDSARERTARRQQQYAVAHNQLAARKPTSA